MEYARLLTFSEISPELFARKDITGHQINRRLLSDSLSGTRGIVVDHYTFPPGFVHHMHRHPNADLIIVPLAGALIFDGDYEESTEVRPGQLLLIPRHSWHELRNASAEVCHVVQFFNGIGELDEMQYEAHPVRGVPFLDSEPN
ncbi:cupin domain-containing protein [Mycobacterium camsae]|uniref:cupin domain-containing protein n=1 Tax=Mycobacterium gordonae TaxID=1778 RepID=UPI00197F6994|nr:cupin domain-containing protein [Mycobacterium gordonae]